MRSRAVRRGLVLAAAAAAWLPAFAQQQPAPKAGAPKPAPQLQIKSQAATGGDYERYEASHRQRLRRESCGRDEDLVKQYCIKRCERGFINTSGESVPRVCRGAKPVPAGVPVPPYRKQFGERPPPPKQVQSRPGA
jgi:hypothetical protein